MMGCDIHAFIEYLDPADSRPWWSNFGGRFSARDYSMFGHLAGVRGDVTQVVPQRGFPEGPVGWVTEDAYYLTITDHEYENTCTLEQAQQWGGKIVYRTDAATGEEIPHRTEGPDWHSASWCTPDELAKVLGTYMLEATAGYTYSVMWDAMLAAMRALEERGLEVRLVFWFDN